MRHIAKRLEMDIEPVVLDIPVGKVEVDYGRMVIFASCLIGSLLFQ